MSASGMATQKDDHYYRMTAIMARPIMTKPPTTPLLLLRYVKKRMSQKMHCYSKNQILRLWRDLLRMLLQRRIAHRSLQKH